MPLGEEDSNCELQDTKSRWTFVLVSLQDENVVVVGFKEGAVLKCQEFCADVSWAWGFFCCDDLSLWIHSFNKA